VQFAGSVLLAGGVTVTEAGAIMSWEYRTGTGIQSFLMFHDVFSGVGTVAGKYAHVAHTIQL
jgi:hypothetical protein